MLAIAARQHGRGAVHAFKYPPDLGPLSQIACNLVLFSLANLAFDLSLGTLHPQIAKPDRTLFGDLIESYQERAKEDKCRLQRRQAHRATRRHRRQIYMFAADLSDDGSNRRRNIGSWV